MLLLSHQHHRFAHPSCFYFRNVENIKVEASTVSIHAKCCENWFKSLNARALARAHTHAHTHTHTHKVYILCRVHASNGYCGRRGKTPLILYLGARRGVLSALRFDRLGLLKTNIGWPRIWSGRVGDDNHLLPRPAL